MDRKQKKRTNDVLPKNRTTSFAIDRDCRPSHCLSAAPIQKRLALASCLGPARARAPEASRSTTFRRRGWRLADEVSNRPMSVTFHLASEHVSDTSFGLDHLRRAWVPFQFAAKTKNLDVDAAIEDVFVDSSRL